jgi:hypothetical protein
MEEMTIRTTGDSEVTVSGNIKSIEDYQAIKEVVRDLVKKGRQAIVVNIPDSLSMTSSVIGFFLKLIYSDNIKITMNVTDERLYNLLDVLNLITVFDVRKTR